MPAVVDKMLPAGVALHHLDGLLDQVATDLHTVELLLAFGNGGIHQRREGTAHADIQPVTALDHTGGLVRGAELALIFRFILEGYSHSVPLFCVSGYDRSSFL